MTATVVAMTVAVSAPKALRLMRVRVLLLKSAHSILKSHLPLQSTATRNALSRPAKMARLVSQATSSASRANVVAVTVMVATAVNVAKAASKLVQRLSILSQIKPQSSWNGRKQLLNS